MKFKTFARTALAAAVVFGAQFAMAEVVVGTKIQLDDGPGTGGGGAFNGSVISGSIGAYGNTFQSFCVEYKEHIGYGGQYYVGGVNNYTVSGITAAGPSQTNDEISSQTAWLFTQFFTTGLTNTSIWGSGDASTKNTALQRAIWFFEDEVASDAAPSIVSGTLEDSYVKLANTAVSSGAWSGIGNVRVLNLFTTRNGTAGNYTYSGNAQDQLYMISAVPEPETYAMMLAGLGIMGAIARRRKLAKQA